jgi:hypothetical protein
LNAFVNGQAPASPGPSGDKPKLCSVKLRIPANGLAGLARPVRYIQVLTQV